MSVQDGYGIYFFKPDHGAYCLAGADYVVAGRAFLRAIDYHTGKIVCNHSIGDGAGTAGVLTTETGLTFSGDVPGNVMALRISDSATLWHAEHRQDGKWSDHVRIGRQAVSTGWRGRWSLYAFALPKGGRQ